MRSSLYERYQSRYHGLCELTDQVPVVPRQPRGALKLLSLDWLGNLLANEVEYRRDPFRLMNSISIRTDCEYRCSEVHGDVVRDVAKKPIVRYNKYLIHLIADSRYTLQHMNLYILAC